MSNNYIFQVWTSEIALPLFLSFPFISFICYFLLSKNIDEHGTSTPLLYIFVIACFFQIIFSFLIIQLFILFSTFIITINVKTSFLLLFETFYLLMQFIWPFNSFLFILNLNFIVSIFAFVHVFISQ